MADDVSSPLSSSGGLDVTSSPGRDLPPFADEASAEDILGGDENEDENVQVEEQEGEELFGDRMERDYRPIPELDIYESEGLDEREDISDELSPTARREAELEMRKRDRAERAARGRMRRGLLYGMALC
jgi:DNA replication licensing factor MCM2